jgi:hypothetical protein
MLFYQKSATVQGFFVVFLVHRVWRLWINTRLRVRLLCMLLNSALFVTLGICTYTIIALVGQLLGASQTSAWGAFINGFSPIPALIIVATNPLFGLALYYGFSVSRFAIPMILAIGACTSFFYSLLFLGATFTLTKLLGLFVIFAGIALLAI